VSVSQGKSISHSLQGMLNCSTAVLYYAVWLHLVYCVQQLSFHQLCPLLHRMIIFGILFSSCYSTMTYPLYDAVWLCLVSCYSSSRVLYYAVWLYLTYCSAALFHQSCPPIYSMITLGKFFTSSYSTSHMLCCVSRIMLVALFSYCFCACHLICYSAIHLLHYSKIVVLFCQSCPLLHNMFITLLSSCYSISHVLSCIRKFRWLNLHLFLVKQDHYVLHSIFYGIEDVSVS
jgi:hypothetical protein